MRIAVHGNTKAANLFRLHLPTTHNRQASLNQTRIAALK